MEVDLRPRYSPQFGQAMCGRRGDPQAGHRAATVGFKAKCAARSFFDREVRRFEGRPIKYFGIMN